MRKIACNITDYIGWAFVELGMTRLFGRWEWPHRVGSWFYRLFDDEDVYRDQDEA